MDFETNPRDAQKYWLDTLRRQPEVMIPFLAHREALNRALYDQLNPPLRWDPGPGVTGQDLPLRRGEAQAMGDVGLAAAGLALPGVAPVLGRGWSGLQALRHLYNASSEQVYGPSASYGSYGPAQRAFDGATQHGEGDPLSPILRLLGLSHEIPDAHHSTSIWDLLGGKE